MKIILGGNHELALNVLKWLIQHNENLKLVISEGLDSDWEVNFENESKILTTKHKIPFLVGDINSYSEIIREINPDLIILCRCRKRIRPEILSIPNIGTTNIHYGLLPRYGGIAPVHWAIRNGEEEIGITLQFMSKEFDEGDIIEQKTFSTKHSTRTVNLGEKILKINGITSWEAYKKSNELGLKIFQDTFPKLKNNNYKRTKQDLTKKLYYTKDSINYETDKILNLKEKSDEEISNLIRAFTFPPCQIPLTYLNNELFELKIES